MERGLTGTLGYLPIDSDILDSLIATGGSNQRRIREELKKRNTDFLSDDRIATVRTIYNPVVSYQNQSILKKGYFDSLPLCIKNLFDTSKIDSFTAEERQEETEKFLAAVLISYKKNPNLTDSDIVELRKDVNRQDKMARQFLQMRIIAQLDRNTATQLLKNLESMLSKYQDYLTREYSFLNIKAEAKNAVGYKKKEVIVRMLGIINKADGSLTPQSKLVKVYEEFQNNNTLLTIVQKPKEVSYWKQIKNFFVSLFNSYNDANFVKNVNNEMSTAIFKQFFKNTINVMQNEPEPTPSDESSSYTISP